MSIVFLLFMFVLGLKVCTTTPSFLSISSLLVPFLVFFVSPSACPLHYLMDKSTFLSMASTVLPQPLHGLHHSIPAPRTRISRSAREMGDPLVNWSN